MTRVARNAPSFGLPLAPRILTELYVLHSEPAHSTYYTTTSYAPSPNGDHHLSQPVLTPNDLQQDHTNINNSKYREPSSSSLNQKALQQQHGSPLPTPSVVVHTPFLHSDTSPFAERCSQEEDNREDPFATTTTTMCHTTSLLEEVLPPTKRGDLKGEDPFATTTTTMCHTTSRLEEVLPPTKRGDRKGEGPKKKQDEDTIHTSSSSSSSELLLRSMNNRFTASLILPYLFLGSFWDAYDIAILQSRNIRRILNVAVECELPPHVVGAVRSVKHLPIRDHSDQDISHFFDDAIQFIRDGVEAGEGVLVHCRMGVSRSATIVLAYLMTYGLTTSSSQQRVSYHQAFDFVKSRRPEISPNFGFAVSLRELDIQHGFRSSVWDEDQGEEAFPSLSPLLPHCHTNSNSFEAPPPLRTKKQDTTSKDEFVPRDAQLLRDHATLNPCSIFDSTTVYNRRNSKDNSPSSTRTGGCTTGTSSPEVCLFDASAIAPMALGSFSQCQPPQDD